MVEKAREQNRGYNVKEHEKLGQKQKILLFLAKNSADLRASNVNILAYGTAMKLPITP